MKVLRVSLFGPVRVLDESGLGEARLTRALQGLLAYLLLFRNRTHPREVLADLFWSNYSQERARGSLNTAVWRLRQALEPEGVPSGTYILSTPQGEVGFNHQSPYWLDIAIFDELSRRVLRQPVQEVRAEDIEQLEYTIQLYRGDFLEGFYDDWALRERERFRLIYLRMLSYLMAYYKKQRLYEKSLQYGQQILDLDPLLEDVHRELIHLYLEHGQRALALRQYEKCRMILAQELGIQPMEETQMLFAHILANTWQEPPLELDTQPAYLQDVLRQLNQARETFSEAREQLEQAIRKIDHFLDQVQLHH